MASTPSTRPLTRKAGDAATRAARRLAGTRFGRRAVGTLRPGPDDAGLDHWLKPLFGDELDRIEAALEGAGPEGYAAFRDLDDDLWSLLLTLEYDGWPGIRSYLPGLPDPALQQMWNGTSGTALAAQSVCFYRKLKEMQGRFGRRGLDRARVLDFGCGWGRLTRMLARDLEPGRLFGCDPVDDILDVCRKSRVPADLARSEFLPESLPFSKKFDLVFSFSVFTHISEAAHMASLEAIHGGLKKDGLLVVTVRPPAYLDFNPLMAPAAAALGPDRDRALEGPRYIFAPHEADGHPQFGGDEMSYGETVITLPYVREKWAPMFELLDVSVLTGDMYQVALTLRRAS